MPDVAAVNARLATLEGREMPDVAAVNARLATLEGREMPDVTDILTRLSAVETRPDLVQRLSALELTVSSLNTN
jgi:hypothetical protein